MSISSWKAQNFRAAGAPDGSRFLRSITLISLELEAKNLTDLVPPQNISSLRQVVPPHPAGGELIFRLSSPPGSETLGGQ